MNTEVGALTILFTEYYYWTMIVFMFLIHVGFCVYEVAASRQKNMMHTLMKNTMLIPVVTITFFLFGWWIYFALPNGPGITGGLVSAPFATPWSELMAPHLGGKPVSSFLTGDDTAAWARLNGVFWGAFLLFALTEASILSGAVIERIRTSAFLVMAVLLGSVLWMIDAAWGWHPDGWMVKVLGYHDAYASGVIHAVAGGFALGVLLVLGQRIGRFRPDGTPRNFAPHNPWLVTIGLFIIYVGFWGFYAACNIPMWDVQFGDGVFFSATNIYLQPTTLSAITFNFMLSLSGGLMMAYYLSKGDAFWTYSGGLAGVIAASAGNDLYHPIQAFVIGAAGILFSYKMHYWVERKFKLDDAVGAVAVHGYTGFFACVVAGFVLWGYPSSPHEGYAHINPLGNLIGGLIMFVVLGFIPGYVTARIFKAFGALRIPRRIELMGLDVAEYHGKYMDEAEIVKAELDEAKTMGLIK